MQITASKNLNYNSWLVVRQMMNTQFRTARLDDSLRIAIQSFHDFNLVNTLPVIDKNDKLVGVLPKKRLYKALLNGADLDSSLTPHIIREPMCVSPEWDYNEKSLVSRVNNSPADYFPVVDKNHKVIGMIGTSEYLKASLKVIKTSSLLMESIFLANYEGIIIIDNNGHILRINSAAARIIDINSTDVRGLHIKDLLSEIIIAKELRLGDQYVINGISVIINQWPIIENNICIGTNITIIDVSNVERMANELKIVQELQIILNKVINTSSDGVFVTDNSGVVKYVNERGAWLVADPLENIKGKPLSTYIKDKAHIRVLESGVLEVGLCNVNGRDCLISHIPIKDNINNVKEIRGVVSTVYLDDNMLSEELARKWFSLRKKFQYYRNEFEKQGGDTFANIISKNPYFIKLKMDAHKIAHSHSTILLMGESGVGKGMFARAIHGASSRAKFPFIKVNCAAIPESLMESELFGYAPNSFTGASQKGKPGYFEQAHKGTIFLDEIGDMPLSTQVKLLHVLEEKQVTRVGGTVVKKVDARIIAATNRNLREAISNGVFREDLLYRLNVINFYIPPLRERPEDITPLVEKFIEKYNMILDTSISGISQAAVDVLEKYHWPGNVRELENAIERAANYVWEGEINIEHLPHHISQKNPDEVNTYQIAINETDKRIILNALERTKGNKSEAARLLRISRSTLYEKLNKYGLKEDKSLQSDKSFHNVN